MRGSCFLSKGGRSYVLALSGQAHVGQALVGPPGPLWVTLGSCRPGACGPGPCEHPWALVVPLGPLGPGPCGPLAPLWVLWALVGPWAILGPLGRCGPPWAFVGRALVGPALASPPGPESLWALPGPVGPPRGPRGDYGPGCSWHLRNICKYIYIQI